MNTLRAPYFLPLAKGCTLLHVDDSGLVALDKPTGVMSTPNSEKDLSKTILKAKYSKKEQAYVWFDKEQIKRFFYVCHRLDSPTSGVLLGALNATIAAETKAHFKNRKIEKTYLALVKGIPRGKNGRWEDKLQTQPEGRGTHVRSSVSGSGEESIAEWRVIKSDPHKRISLLELKPKTGRTHQLRVQCAHHELPIIGDRTYGDFPFNSRAKKEWGIQRLMLHAGSLKLLHAQKRQPIIIESPAPDDFFQLFDK